MAINNSPEVYSQSAFTLEDNSVQLFFTGYDSDGDGLTFTIEDSPDYGSITIDDTGNIATYIPNANYNGQDSFTFKSYDGILYSENAATATISITEVNDAPYAGSIENIEVPENSSVIIELENYIGDYEDHTNSLNITFLPEASDNESNIIGSTFYGGLIVDLGSNEYQYTPSTNNTPLEDFILYKVSDGQLESEPALISFSIPWGRPGVFRRGINNAVSQLVDTE